MVEVKNVFKYYGEQRVLNGLSLSISKGEIVSVVGSSGSGKTTLLSCLLYTSPSPRDLLKSRMPSSA